MKFHSEFAGDSFAHQIRTEIGSDKSAHVELPGIKSLYADAVQTVVSGPGTYVP